MKKYIKASQEIQAKDILSLFDDVLPNAHARLNDERQNLESLLNPDFESDSVIGSTIDKENLKAAQENLKAAIKAVITACDMLDDWKYDNEYQWK